MKGTVRKVGLGYVYHHGRALFKIDRLRESRGELSGELTVTVEGEHLARGRVNLSSISARASLAKLLDARDQEASAARDPDDRRPPIKWAAALEAFDVGVLQAERKGAPFQLVGRQPRQEAPPRMLGDMCVENEVTLIYAAMGTGKSTLGGAIAVSLQTGKEIIPGWKPAKTGPVLIVDGEWSFGSWNNKVAEIAAGFGIEPPEIHYRRLSGPMADTVEEIAAFVADKGIIFILGDSVEALCGASNSAEGFQARVDRLFQAIRQVGCTWLLLDHVSGDDMKSSGAVSKPINSVMKMAWARQIFELKREKEPADGRAEILLICTKVNDTAKLPPQGLAMIYGEHSIRFERTTVTAPELVDLGATHADRIERLLKEGPQEVGSIATELDVKGEVVRAVLNRGSKAGRFIKLSSGWALPSPQPRHFGVSN